ncbi:MAG: hypothetical protein M3O91_05675 [Chloroflexota bacterium]|nr:hypothetical protein [Chloroflexota bacterium]
MASKWAEDRRSGPARPFTVGLIFGSIVVVALAVSYLWLVSGGGPPVPSPAT